MLLYTYKVIMKLFNQHSWNDYAGVFLHSPVAHSLLFLAPGVSICFMFILHLPRRLRIEQKRDN